MADSTLQERLRDHAKAFDGLLSLIPAKMYYGEDTSDQWRKKKQTKDEARAAKRGKLDPDSELNRNAKEVLDERARNKRKLREMEAEEESGEGSGQDDDSDISGIEREKPGEGLKKKLKLDEGDEEEEEEKEEEKEEVEVEEKAPKKQKAVEEAPEQGADEPALSKKAQAKEKKLAKKQKQEEAKKAKEENPKKAKKAEKTEKAKKVEKVAAKEDESEAEESTTDEAPVQPSAEAESDDEVLAPIDVSGLANEEDTSAESTPESPTFDTVKNASVEPASTTTSISSAVPPSEKPKYLKIPADTTALRARLEAKLMALRADRKADDSEGKPIRTRQDLIESRREKQAQRKAHKQEMRRLAKEEEDRKREQALNSARNSPGLSPLFDQDDDRNANHFAFGRLAFSDGTQLSHDLSYEKGPASAKKKGPSDPKTALLKLEAQKKRVANMDEDKRKEVLEKETWLAARKRAEGVKVHDNESLLKKALKRKEKSKKKSEREWKDRAEDVKTSIHQRQRKREDNLRKRRDEKAAHKSGKKKNKGVQTKKKNRPGFEGGFGGGRK